MVTRKDDPEERKLSTAADDDDDEREAKAADKHSLHLPTRKELRKAREAVESEEFDPPTARALQEVGPTSPPQMEDFRGAAWIQNQVYKGVLIGIQIADDRVNPQAKKKP